MHWTPPRRKVGAKSFNGGNRIVYHFSDSSWEVWDWDEDANDYRVRYYEPTWGIGPC